MTTCLIVFLVALLVAVATTELVRRVSLRMGVLDRPDAYRKRHKVAVPSLGGIAIFLAFIAALTAIRVFNPYLLSYISQGNEREVTGCVIGGLLALLIGVVDDLRALKAAHKLALQVLPVLVMYASGCAIHAISLPLMGSVELGWMSLPATMLWVLICMNAVNLLDGLDGLAAGVALCVTLTLFIVSVLHHHVPSMVLLACLSGATLGFLLFNFHPARIFLGDSGSMFLGFMLAGGSLMAARSDASVALLVPAIALGLPIMDTSLAVCRRWYKRLPLDTSDRHHVHHLLVSMGWSHPRAVLLLYLVCVVLGLCSVLVALEQSELTVLVLGSLGVMAFVVGRVLGGKKLGEVMAVLSANRESRRLSMDAAAAVELAIQGMSHAATPDELWSMCHPAFERLDLASARVDLSDTGSMAQDALTWGVGFAPSRWDGGATDVWQARLVLGRESRPQGFLEVTKSASSRLPMPDLPRQLDIVRNAVSRELRRLAGEQPVRKIQTEEVPLASAVEAMP